MHRYPVNPDHDPLTYAPREEIDLKIHEPGIKGLHNQLKLLYA